MIILNSRTKQELHNMESEPGTVIFENLAKEIKGILAYQLMHHENLKYIILIILGAKDQKLTV